MNNFKAFQVYHRELQPLGTSQTYDYLAMQQDRIDQVIIASDAWISRTAIRGSKLCGLPIKYLRPDNGKGFIDMNHYLYIQGSGLLKAGITGFVNVNKLKNKIVFQADESENATPQAPDLLKTLDADLVKILRNDHALENSANDELYKFIAAWIRCQVICESDNDIISVSLPDMLADYYSTKASYAAVLSNRGLVVLTIPVTLQKNKQLSDILVDIISSRNGAHSTLFVAENDQSLAGDEDVLKRVRESVHIVNLNDAFDKLTESAGFTCARSLMHKYKLIEVYEECNE